MFINLPTDEELNAATKKHNEAQLKALEPHGAFLVTSLTQWMKAISSSNVMQVGAYPFAEILASDWKSMETPSKESEARLRHVAELIKQELKAYETFMVRWDFCSGSDLKYVMSKGSPKTEELTEAKRNLQLDDPRAFEILFDYPYERIPVVSREWREPKVIDGFPVEFRAFVQNNEIIGIASYYPQRPLLDNAEIMKYVEKVRLSTNVIIKHILDAGEYPWVLGYESAFERNTINASIDFLIDVGGDAVFLEAGPAWGFGSHPCAFLGGEVKGLALALADGVELR